MNVLFVSPEVYPLIKTGGLADVTGALPLALGALGVDVRVLLPAYRGVAAKVDELERVGKIDDLFGGPADVLRGVCPNGLQVLLLDAAHLYNREGGPYLDATGQDWGDNDVRFAALSVVGALIGRGELGDWTPDLVHLHDWQAAPTTAYLRDNNSFVPTVLTIHNLAFQGLFGMERLDPLGLSPLHAGVDGMEYYSYISFLKAGIRYASAITTVSPTYA